MSTTTAAVRAPVPNQSADEGLTRSSRDRARSELVTVSHLELRPMNANRPPALVCRAQRKQQSVPNLLVLGQYQKYSYLHYGQMVATGYLHNVQLTLTLSVPEVVVTLCVSYAFNYDDGMLQLAYFVRSALDKWQRPSISKKLLRTLIAYFLQTKTTTNKQYTESEIQAHFDEFLSSEYVVSVHLKRGAYIAFPVPASSTSTSGCAISRSYRYYRLTA